ncbi:MAG: hypothetical protein HZC41_25550 [Chloroflexi bacterium]|nr:hypothetical protein [Chloroflexota bacterium]
MSERELRCPQCKIPVKGGDLNHKKVSGVYAASWWEERDSEGWRVKKQTPLGESLRPPSQVYIPPLDSIDFLFFCGLAFYLLIIGFWAFFGLYIIFTSGHILGFIVLAVVVFAILRLPKEFARRRKAKLKAPKKAAAINLAYELWDSSYYCEIHDWVFNAEKTVNVPSRYFQSFLQGKLKSW